MKTTHTLKKFAGMALILCVVLALINCSSPSNGTATSSGTGSNPGLSKLNVTINRNDSTTSKFVFRTTHPTNTDSYSASGVSGISLVDKQDSPARVEITATGLTTSPTALTVTAKDSAMQDTSIATKVPAMLKYNAATADVDAVTDWFNFLGKTLFALGNINTTEYMNHTDIYSLITGTSFPISPAAASAFLASPDKVKANDATASILNNWNAIYTYLSGADKATVDVTLPRIWFNDVPNPSNGATFNTVMLNWFKAQGYDVNIVS